MKRLRYAISSRNLTSLNPHHPRAPGRDARLIGSVSLIRDDLPGREDLNPWLASLYVMPRFRNLGYGRLLVQEAVRLCGGFGYDRIFLFTESARSYFARFGFVAMDVALANGRPVTIMELTELCQCRATPI